MFKKIFKAAKNLARSPVGQIGIGLLAPSLFPGVSPALLQGGIGLLGGSKPEDVLRNVALGAASAGAYGGKEGIGNFFTGQQLTPRVISNAAATRGGIYDTGTQSMIPGTEGKGFPVNDIATQVKEDPGFLRKFGLVKDTVMDENGNVREADFFEKYGNILKLGAIGSSVAAAALGEDQAQALYDPNQNPYLTGSTKISDVYTPIEYKQGGILDFPEKDGMINGPGNGQSDDIPAMLSDGEFVMTKQAVMAAGNGDRDQGTKKMYSMMNSLENKADNMGIGRM